jgi:hypothetical protein
LSQWQELVFPRDTQKYEKNILKKKQKIENKNKKFRKFIAIKKLKNGLGAASRAPNLGFTKLPFFYFYSLLMENCQRIVTY